MPAWFAYVLSAVVALALGFLTYIAAKRTSDRDRLTKLETRLDAFEKRLGHRDDYVNVLRDHIDRRLGPPPPPYPANYFD